MNSNFGDVSQQSDNFNSIEEIDPSLEDKFQIVFDKEVPLELRTNVNGQASQEVGSLESIKIRILVQMQDSEDEERKYQTIKIELTSETDLFFFYVSIIEEENFMDTKKEHRIKVRFDEYLDLLIRLFNQCYKEPHNYFGVFHMLSEGVAKLNFIENMEYKFSEIVSLDFIQNSEDQVKQNIIYRYNVLKAKMIFVQSRLEDISNLIKLKNPSLLVQIQRSTIGAQLSSSILRQSNNQKQNTSRFLK